MRSWRSNRVFFFLVSLFLCLGLIVASQTGLLGPVRGLVATPLNWISGLFNGASNQISDGLDGFTDVETLRQRNADLEEALAQFQSELVELREIASDYTRLTQLLNYTSSVQNQEFLSADVIAIADANAPLRTIVINRGGRDGVAVGMPVVTDDGLVGRVLDVASTASRVLLVNDISSAISARLQTSRAQGSVTGQASGDLIMEFIPLDAAIEGGDLVISSGLGGNLPPDLVLGQVTSSRLNDNGLFRQAVVRSLIDFDSLEIVLIVTNFQPIDLSVFDDPEAEN